MDPADQRLESCHESFFYSFWRQNAESLKPKPSTIYTKLFTGPRKRHNIPEGYISISEASKRLSTSVRNIHGFVKSGRLQSITINSKSSRLFIKEPCVLEDLITVDQASRRLKTTSKRIWDLIQDNMVEFTVKNDKSVLIFGNSLNNPDIINSTRDEA